MAKISGKSPAVRPLPPAGDLMFPVLWCSERHKALPHEIFLSTAYVESFGGCGLQSSALEIVDEIFDW